MGQRTKVTAKKAASKARSAAVKAARRTKKVAHTTRRTTTKTARKLAATKPYQKTKTATKASAKLTKKAAKKTHHVIAKKPHEKLMAKGKRYARWHSWNWRGINHNHVHGMVVTAWTFIVITVFISNTIMTNALSAWTQTDWSGGQGSSTVNQFASRDNIDIGNSSFNVSPNENLTNSGFETNLEGWDFKADSFNFSLKTDYPTSSLPQSLKTGDLDNDGDMDVVISNNGSASISVYKNNGDGTFAAKTDYTAGAGAHGFELGDLDNDGDLDIAMVNYNAYTMSILLNNGNGTFAAKVDYATGSASFPQYVTLGDIDNDGDLDAAVTLGQSHRVSIFKNNGDGTFAARVDYVTGSWPTGLTMGDVDADNDLDIIVPNVISDSVSVLKNNGDGTFAARVDYTAGDGAHTARLGDLDDDGDLDIAVVNGNTGANTVSVLKNNGNGTFAAKTDYQVGAVPNNLTLNDLDNDGDIDIITNNYGSHAISILRNNGDATFGNKSDISTNASPYMFSLADLDQDGDLDIAVTSRDTNTFSIIKNTGSTAAHSTEQGYSSNSSIKVVATNASGKLMQMVNIGSTEILTISLYAYTDGSAITSADASLYVGNATVATSYTDVGNGWYKLSAQVTGSTTERKYGVQVEAGKTVYIDNVSLHDYGTGTLVSSIMDTELGSAWGNITYASSGTGEIVVKARTSNNADMSGAPAFAGCVPVASGSDLTGESCVTDNHRYIQYEVTLTGQNGQTPVFEDITIEYSPYDNTPPDTNATNIVMKKSAGGGILSENDWTNGSTPYFEWTAGEDEGTGLKGYCLYLGTDSTADPVMTKGVLGTSPVNTDDTCPFVVSTPHIDTATSGLLGTALASSTIPYYLNIKAIDNAHNVYDGPAEQVHFRFDNTVPKNPEFITAPSQFISDKEVTLTWPTSGNNAASDAHSGLVGLQYKIGNDGIWYGDSHNGNQDATDLLANDGTYVTVDPHDFERINEGNNVVYFRTWDAAGNVSTTYVTTVIKLNTSAPTSPQNVVVSPSINTENFFAFTWVEPSSFQGSAESLSYCYTVNTLPTNNTCSWTDPGVTSLAAGPYATQPGENTFYVVARDETGSVNYATAASVTFTANTPAPGIPLDLEIADVSTKATSSWKLALTWNQPTHVGVGIATYRIYRSTDGANFTQVATTAGTSIVESGLSQVEYYYRVRACDSANNCGAFSSTISKLPTGRYTEPPEIISQPSATVSTRSATIRWATDRTSDSRIQYGTSSGEYFETEAASSVQTKNHDIELSNLDAGTTYFYRARWTDEDGNVGTSSELSFTTLPAPLIKNVEIRRTTVSTAIIQFTVESATKVNFVYGKTEAFGGLKSVNTSLSESTYTVDLDGLDDGTRYYFGINPVDSDGNEYKASRVDNFTTPARPRITNLRFQPLEGEPTSTQVVTWETNVPTSSLVRFSSKGLANKELSSSRLAKSHKIIVRGLEDDTMYSFVAESRDIDGNLALSDTQVLRTALDTRPPKISNVQVETTIRGTGAEARGQIIVSWTTDEPATSQVAYVEGTASTEFNNRTMEDATLATEHVVIVSDLPTSRIYNVLPVSRDASKNSSEAQAQSAIIGRASDSVMTIVLNTLRRVFGF